MPVVFSPGEPETRPLEPEAIVYTTAQKVADLLGVGRGEAVLASANSVSDGVFVTGGDFRDHGFAVNDSVLIYSDLDPLGTELNITSIANGGASGVKLVTDTSFTHSNFTTAANTYVQNTASFTNGKTRGVTKAIVETRIKEIQDRIDNITHNAWRPYLVAAEYINFDTYKPYRRRYYTDYVGTTPLLFRNVQQILRLEIWQGENYRELAGAEARLEIVDESGLSTDNVYIGLANGSIATLTEGSDVSTKWRADFDKVSAAQNLADLINNEDRVSKAAVDFSPTFTLEGSTSNVALHNEILATANADYGNGKVKLTSMRQTKGGENVSIAMSDVTNMTLSQVTTNTVTSHVYSTGIRVDHPSGGSTAYDATTTNFQLDSGYQAKFAVGDKMYNESGTELGTVAEYISTTVVRLAVPGLTTSITNDEILYTARMALATDATKLHVAETDLSSFPAAGLLFISNGTSTRVAKYTSKDTSSFSTGNLFGRFNGVTDVTNSFIANVGGASGSGAKGTVNQNLFQSDIGAFSDAGGDQARLKDWWLDSEMGIIYFNNSYPFFEWNAVKVSYIYGERYLEKAIEEAATKLTASELLMADDRSVLIPEGTQNVDLGSKIQLYRQEAMEILNRYKEIVVFA